MSSGYREDGREAGYAPARTPGYAPARTQPPAPWVAPAWWADVVGSAVWASVLVTLALWLAGRGLQDLTSVIPGLTSLGRLAGLVAADLLLVQVVLMARIPAVERPFGQDALARWHRRLGFASFALLLVHILFITLGYSGRTTNPVSQFVDLVLNYPGMLLALAGTVLLVLVVITSVRAARARLRYESWHLLHLYAYLGAGLAVPHQIWTGTEFTASPPARLYWWSLWAAAAGSVLVWRLGLPLWRSLHHDLRVEAVVPETTGVVSIYVTGHDLDRLRANAGQFFIWRFLSGPGWTRGNPYSLSALPQPGRLRITVKALGDNSGRLAQLTPGTRVLVEGPHGRMHAGARTRHRVTLLASGIGITPMRALMEQIRHRPGELTLIYRASSDGELILRDEIDRLSAANGARVFYVLGPRIPDRASWLPEAAAALDDRQALLQLVPDLADHDVFLCGAEPWMEAARLAALEAGVPPEHLHLERFRW